MASALEKFSNSEYKEVSKTEVEEFDFKEPQDDRNVESESTDMKTTQQTESSVLYAIEEVPPFQITVLLGMQVIKRALDNILKFYFWLNFIYHVKCNC